jgi:hypothetical protein
MMRIELSESRVPPHASGVRVLNAVLSKRAAANDADNQTRIARRRASERQSLRHEDLHGSEGATAAPGTVRVLVRRDPQNHDPARAG